MLRSYWREHPAARLGALVIAAVCALTLGYGLLESADYERQATYNAQDYAKHTGDKVAQTCVSIPPVEKAECLANAFEAQREYEYNQADLVAQRQSALWGYLMAAAAIIGMGLSAVGVALVWTTFRATKEANEIARRGQRGWLEIITQIERFSQGEKQVSASYVVTVRNVGSDVAKDVQFDAALFRFFSTVDEECDAFLEAPLPDHRPYKRPRSILPNGETVYRSAVNLPVDKIGDIEDSGNRRIYSLLFVAKVTYRANQDIANAHTFASFNLTHATMGAFRHHPGEHYDADHLRQFLGQYNDAR